MNMELVIEKALKEANLKEKEQRLQELDKKVSEFINGNPTEEESLWIRLFFDLQQKVNRLKVEIAKIDMEIEA